MILLMVLACGGGTPDAPASSSTQTETEPAPFDAAAYLAQCEQTLCELEAVGCDTELGCEVDGACQAALAEDCNFTWQEEAATACLEGLAAAVADVTCLSPGDWTALCGEVFTWDGEC